MACLRAPAYFRRVTALVVMALSGVAAHGAPLPGIVLAERVADPVSKGLFHHRFTSTGSSDLRAAVATEASRPVAMRSLNGVRGTGVLTASPTPVEQPPDTGHDARLAQLRPIADRWASDPEWMQSARKIHREGVPLLRPWQNSKMFVSLGVNAKGVPGIYLVQKTAR